MERAKKKTEEDRFSEGIWSSPIIQHMGNTGMQPCYQMTMRLIGIASVF